ncbi:Phosphoenolpyruvate-protein phosphotransferase [Enhygromyxa salina]|uniref:Phosphoenolpyruvate-protein phosphotransferase n=1 Tax=Enhygromyxa salina TaxID=215803 RepID=A0A2S9YE28_9BACT|nr:phosphoenolpyruvate--protein phosphotransferase [Enhygromyxa salina]PRQ03266.1 Phosphoenolpyruvate-protein phosphotransferase [Enhygromyxa salina]
MANESDSPEFPELREVSSVHDGALETVELRGNAVSPGLAIGPAYVVDRREVNIPRTHIEREAVDEELLRFRVALRGAQDQLEAIKGRLTHGEHRQILKAQQMMLRDPDLIQRTEALIKADLINAEWAVSRSVDEIRETLAKATDRMFRERQFDVAFMGERLITTLGGEERDAITPPEGSVVVAHDLSPADTAQLARYQVTGLVTEEGGQTSHTAIIARALQMPAVVGVDDLLEAVETGDLVIVDGVHGLVHVRPSPAQIDALELEVERYVAFEQKIHKEHALPAQTFDGETVHLRANLALDEEIDAARHSGAEGVGLYRTEFMFMNRENAPSEEEHYRSAKALLQRWAPYPVRIRTFDLGSDKQCPSLSTGEVEANPAMGLRSMRLALRRREEFLAQLRGLLRAALHGPLQIMLPLVSGLEELAAGREAFNEARAQLVDQGMPHAAHVSVGVMIEVPSAAVIADLLARHVDFMSIGSNDLIQYTLAIDRENDDVNYLYEPLHPAILRMIKLTCDAGAKAGIPVSLCGEMAADPRYTWVLVGLGLRELSMQASAIPVVKNIIRSSSLDEMEALAAAVLESETGDHARRLVLDQISERFGEHLQHTAGLSPDDDEQARISAVGRSFAEA